jgi:hypothetical protein
MGLCQRASKNKKGTENPPSLSIIALWLRSENSFLKSHILPEVTNYECNLSLKTLKTCLKLVLEKCRKKYKNEKFATFLSPFLASSNRMQTSLTSPN